MQVADRFTMEWKLFYDNKVKRVAILVSCMDHCLYDLLIRHRAGAPPVVAPSVVAPSVAAPPVVAPFVVAAPVIAPSVVAPPVVAP